MMARTCNNHGSGVERRVPEMRRMVEFNCISSSPMSEDYDQTGPQSSKEP